MQKPAWHRIEEDTEIVPGALPTGSKAWPLVTADDDGIRPAGETGRCFYCDSRIGSEHGRECVCVTKVVRLRYSFLLEVPVPHFWDEEKIVFHRNDNCWCADNALEELEKSTDESGCLCSRFECSLADIVDVTPRRKRRPAKSFEATHLLPTEPDSVELCAALLVQSQIADGVEVDHHPLVVVDWFGLKVELHADAGVTPWRRLLRLVRLPFDLLGLLSRVRMDVEEVAR